MDCGGKLGWEFPERTQNMRLYVFSHGPGSLLCATTITTNSKNSVAGHLVSVLLFSNFPLWTANPPLNTMLSLPYDAYYASRCRCLAASPEIRGPWLRQSHTIQNPHTTPHSPL